MPMEIGNSFDPLRFCSCFKSISKDSPVRVDVLNTSNSCHKTFINKNEIKTRRTKREIETFPTTYVYSLCPRVTLFYLSELIKHRSVS